MKEFVDAGGMTQRRRIPPRIILVDPNVQSKHIEDLTPFTTYSVNVTAIPKDSSYRPPARIQVTTMMAGLCSFKPKKKMSILMSSVHPVLFLPNAVSHEQLTINSRYTSLFSPCRMFASTKSEQNDISLGILIYQIHQIFVGL